MKTLLFLLLLLPGFASSQQLALLDRKFKEPFLLRDTFTLDDLAQGAFPIYTEDIPEVIGQLQIFARQLAANDAINEVAPAMNQAHSQIFLSRKKNIYWCVLNSKNKQFSVPLVVGAGSRKATLKKVNRFMEYLRQNKTIVLDRHLSAR